MQTPQLWHIGPDQVKITFLNESLQLVFLSPAAPKARDGRYCNAPRLSVCPSVRPSVRHV